MIFVTSVRGQTNTLVYSSKNEMFVGCLYTVSKGCLACDLTALNAPWGWTASLYKTPAPGINQHFNRLDSLTRIWINDM